MEQKSPPLDDLAGELQLLQSELWSVKQAESRITKAAVHLGNSIKLLCEQERSRWGSGDG